MNDYRGAALLIPPIGLLECYHSSEPIDSDKIEAILEASGGRYGGVVTATVDGGATRSIYLALSDDQENPRAREACASLFGWHMVFTGSVLIADLTPEEATDLIRELS